MILRLIPPLEKEMECYLCEKKGKHLGLTVYRAEENTRAGHFKVIINICDSCIDDPIDQIRELYKFKNPCLAKIGKLAVF